MARKVTDVAPGLAAGHTNLGLALMRQGRFAEAEGSLLSSLRIRESAGLLLNIGALYYAQQRFEDARRYFERCLALGPPTVIRLVNLGDAYRHLGRVRRHGRLPARDGSGGSRSRAIPAASRGCFSMIAAQLGDRRRAEAELSQPLARARQLTVIRQAAIGYEALGLRAGLTILSRAPRACSQS